MIPESGQRFGPYELQARLGGGGMGHVFRAWDARLHREVAVKLLHNEYVMPGMRERFLREARAASALNHPNICTVFDIGEQDGDPYLVMELLQGETLRDRIERSTIQPDQLVAIAREVAEGLEAAHSKGIVHRDIKPANIFLLSKPNGKSQAKVLDFGLAKIDERGPGGVRGRSIDITTVGATVGTLAYMSPEQARGEPLDLRSDLFSLGVVLYEMATRHIPFPGATSALIFVKLLNELPEPVRDWNDSIPRDLERIIQKLMSKERTARYQTATELDEALGRLTERPNSNWLRKAVATVPLVRAPDPVARERRAPSRRRSSDSQVELPANSRDGSISPVPPVPRTTSDQPQVLRPVSRMPRDDGARASGNLLTPLTPSGRAMTAPDGAQAPDAAGKGSQSELDRPPASAAGRADVPAAPGRLPDQAVASASSRAAQPPAIAPPEPAEADAVDESHRQNGDFDPLAVPLPKPLRSVDRLVWAAIVGLVLLALIAVLLYLHHSRGGSLLTAADTLAVTEMENRTGDKTLDGTIATGLTLDLLQSPYVKIAGPVAFLSALHASGVQPGDPVELRQASEAAKKIGAKAFIFGSVQGTTPPYTLRAEVRDTASGDLLATVEEQAAGLAELPGAIDRLADDLRSTAGETSESINASHVPLVHESTSSLEALHAYSQAEAAFTEGRLLDALPLLQSAVTTDPHFVQAQLSLVVLYRKERAEVAAADASRAALAASDAAGERTRTLAQYEYEVNSSGDLHRATALIRHLLSERPHDALALADLARVLRLQGRLTDALAAAQESYAADPFELDAYVQAETALISLDRYEAALGVENQVQHLGMARIGGSLIGAYLEGRDELLAHSLAEFQSGGAGHRAQWNYGLYLDNSGQLALGETTWRSAATADTDHKGLGSAAGTLLAQGALDRALVGDCGQALDMLRDASGHPRGRNALFNSGMTDALCHEPSAANELLAELQSAYPQSSDLNDFEAADLKAAVALDGNDPAAALTLLQPARQFDLISLTPLLRGRAHVALQQVQVGIVDFQTVLSHRGITFTVGTDAYPAAEIGVARAFAATGDAGNSAEAYRRFLVLWKLGDARQPLIAEARAKAAPETIAEQR